MPSAVFSDEPTVEVSRGTLQGMTLTEGDVPLFEIVLDPDPDVSVESNDALLGVVGPGLAPVVELVTEAAEPTLDIMLEEEAIVDISAVGVQGAPGDTGTPGPSGPAGPAGPPGAAGIGASIDFVFDFPLNVWPLQHNLGRRLVDVVTVDNNNDEMIGDVTYVNENYAEVEWYYATPGRATVST